MLRYAFVALVFAVIVAVSVVALASECSAAEPTERGTAMFDAINYEREVRGVPALDLNKCAVFVAQARSADMANLGYFSHTSPSGETAKSLLEEHCKQGGVEIIARNNYSRSESVRIAVRDLMASGIHRSVVINSNYTSGGAAVVEDESGMKYYTVVFLK